MLAACWYSDNHTKPCVLNWWNNLRISLFIEFSAHSKTKFLFRMAAFFHNLEICPDLESSYLSNFGQIC